MGKLFLSLSWNRTAVSTHVVYVFRDIEAAPMAAQLFGDAGQLINMCSGILRLRQWPPSCSVTLVNSFCVFRDIETAPMAAHSCLVTLANSLLCVQGY